MTYFLSLFLCGCASITTGQYQRVPIDSYPQEAKVVVSSGYRGVTPCSFDLKRNANHIIKISKEGYRTAQIALRKTLCGSTAGNIIIGGVIGLGVDAMTGAMFKLVPENVYVELVPGDSKDVIVVEPATRKKTKKAKEDEKVKDEGTEIAPKK